MSKCKWVMIESVNGCGYCILREDIWIAEAVNTEILYAVCDSWHRGDEEDNAQDLVSVSKST